MDGPKCSGLLSAAVDAGLAWSVIQVRDEEARRHCSIRAGPTPQRAPVPPSTVAAHSTTARDDYFGIEGEGTTPRGQAVDVTVHVCSGMLEELEVFAGEGIATGLPAPDSLRAVALI